MNRINKPVLSVLKKFGMSANMESKRPLVWVFGGMASQWPGMGKCLLKIQTFKETIERCHDILKEKGLDLLNIITTDDPDIFDNILNSFVGIGSIQIALINVLRDLKMKPDYFIGHSFGEVACGYADGCLSEEQAVLTAYYCGFLSLNSSEVVGRMAVIKLCYQSLVSKLPDDIDAACHNSPNSCTVSGSKESVEQFVDEMKSQNIMAFIIDTSNVAFHSRYIAHLCPKLEGLLDKVIISPKQRSKKWLSTSALSRDWNNCETKICSGKYYTNNLCRSVYFEEALSLLPRNSICLEIAPDGVLLPGIILNVPDGLSFAVAKEKEEGVQFLINALQSLQRNGVQLDIGKMEKMFDSS
ncbi:hypothetical protein ACFFRR_001698 [Megaselia abdita]